MEGELDPFVFVLAERLGITLGQLDEMPLAEFYQWAAFYEYRNAMQELAAKEAK